YSLQPRRSCTIFPYTTLFRSILIQVMKQSDANAVSVSELGRKSIADIEKDYADDNVKLSIANDSSQFTLTAADNVIFDLFLAIRSEEHTSELQSRENLVCSLL